MQVLVVLHVGVVQGNALLVAVCGAGRISVSCVCVHTSVGYTAVLLAHPAKGKAAATSIGLGERVLRVHHDGLQWLESRNPGVPESGGGSSFLRSFNTCPLQKLNKSGRRIVTKNSRT